jgi:hypothetical protein
LNVVRRSFDFVRRAIAEDLKKRETGFESYRCPMLDPIASATQHRLSAKGAGLA